jgi:hypothetical protein
MQNLVAKLSSLPIKLKKVSNLLKALEELVDFLGIKSILMKSWITIEKILEEKILILMKISFD